MPVSYTKSGGQGHEFSVPDYPEAADAPKAFKDFADYLDLLLPPVGAVLPFAGASAPTGWLLCDGSEYNTTSYPKLAALVGTSFGTATAGKFKVPDLRGRTVAGLNASDADFATMGKTGGAKSVALTVSNMPSHSHGVPNHIHTGSGTVTIAAGGNPHQHAQSGTFTTSDPGGHQHDTRVSSPTNFDRASSGLGASYTGSNTSQYTASSGAHTHTVTLSGNTAAATDSHTHTGTVNLTFNSSGATTTDSAGSGAAFNTISPYLTLNHIIRAA